jgi:hypothetical protein
VDAYDKRLDNPYQTGDRVWYVALDYGADHVTFSDAALHVNKNDPGLVTRIVDERTVMVLWLNDNDVSEHDVSCIKRVPRIDDRHVQVALQEVLHATQREDGPLYRHARAITDELAKRGLAVTAAQDR